MFKEGFDQSAIEKLKKIINFSEFWSYVSADGCFLFISILTAIWFSLATATQEISSLFARWLLTISLECMLQLKSL